MDDCGDEIFVIVRSGEDVEAFAFMRFIPRRDAECGNESFCDG